MKAVILAQASSGLAGSDLLNLKISHFQDGIREVYDDSGELRRLPVEFGEEENTC
jgi:hypothetical protein